MRIDKDFNAKNKYQTFCSNRRLKSICRKTMNEFNQEFKDIEPPYKAYNRVFKSKTEKEAWEWANKGIELDEKFTKLKEEFDNFCKTTDSYPKKMEKLKELMHKHKVANCEQINNYFQYMLAQKGIYSEQIEFDIFNGITHEDHQFPRVKKSPNSTKSFIADAFLNAVEEESKFLTTMQNYFMAKNLSFKDWHKVRCIDGYQEFLNSIPINELANQNSLFSLFPKSIKFFKRILF